MTHTLETEGDPATARWPLLFYAAATIYILIGVTWGLAMSVTHDFTTSPAHAHLNLIGWVSQALMGAFYATLGRRSPGWMPAANFVLTNVGVVCMISAMTLMFMGVLTMEEIKPLFAIGGPGVLLGFAVFACAVFTALARSLGVRRAAPLASAA
ncbi:MAG: hypothetical protein ACOY4G_03290 [Pseudomonadota bacterium]